MKKRLALVLSALWAMAMACTAWAVNTPSNIGVAKGELPTAFQGKEAVLEENCKKAYAWAMQLHAKEAEDGGFQFGQSTDELLHATDMLRSEISGDVILQDFDGGNSASRDAFLFDNWAALICTDSETCQVIVLRDAVAEYMAKGGGVGNLPFGAPTTNQYWRMEDDVPVLYQQTENGYFRAEQGEPWFMRFHNQWAEGGNYQEPPQPPAAYGPVDEPSPDGCTWENPLYIGWNAAEEPASSADTNTDDGQASSVISDPGPDAFIYEGAPAGNTAAGTSTDTAAVDTLSTSAPAENTSAPAAETSADASGPESRVSSNREAAAHVSDTSGWNAGLTAGIAVGIVVITGGLFCLYWFVLRRKKAAPAPEDQPPENDNTEYKG